MPGFEWDNSRAITTHVVGRDGIEVRARTTWLFTIRGRKVERVCLYQETQEALNDATH